MTEDDKQRLSQNGCGRCQHCSLTYCIDGRYYRYGGFPIFCEGIIKKPCIIDMDYLKIQVEKMHTSDFRLEWLLR